MQKMVCLEKAVKTLKKWFIEVTRKLFSKCICCQCYKYICLVCNLYIFYTFRILITACYLLRRTDVSITL